MRIIIVQILLTFSSTFCVAQNIDSIINVCRDNNQIDTVRLNSYTDVANYLSRQYPDSAIKLATEQIKLAKKVKSKKYEAEALQTIATAYYFAHNIDTCLSIYQKSLDIFRSIGMENNVASLYNNMGIMYEIQGKFLTSIQYYLDGLAIREKSENKPSAAKLHMNIANLYFRMNDMESSEKHMNQAYTYFIELNDSSNLISSFMGFALLFQEDSTRRDSSFVLYKKCIKLADRMGDIYRKGQCQMNLGVLYMENKDLEKAESYFIESENNITYSKNVIAIASLKENFGSLNYYRKNYAKGIKLCKEGMEMAQQHQLRELERNTCECLYKNYFGLKDYKSALEYYIKFVEIREELNNEEINKKVARKEVEMEYNMKLFSDSLAHAEQQHLKEIEHTKEVEKQKTYTYIGALGAALLLVILAILFRGYTQRKKSNILLEEKNQLIIMQKNEVETQKLLVEEKSKEITDSIEYAKNIQYAILPPMALFKKHLPDGFVLFKPKDVVSGDFYWLEHLNDTTFFAVADCTGHGVPGAMVSVVCSNALSRAVKEFQLKDPGKILDKARELVLETFAKSDRDVKDGMDIALCSLTGNKLQYAGAQNPLWILKDGTSDMEEIKGDKQPVGSHIDSKSFTTHTIELAKGDSIYLFSDGFPDQFGGERGKKLKYKPFMEMLIEHSNIEANAQRDMLEKEFIDWKGTNEQIDDVCILCVKI